MRQWGDAFSGTVAPVMKLELFGGKTYSGNLAGAFVDAKLFDFAPLGRRFDAPKH